MAITGKRSISLTFTGDITYQQVFAATDNLSANGEQLFTDLAPGFNAFTIPVAGATVPTAVTIIPPSANVQTMTLKGVTGDTGIPINRSNPTSVALATTATTFGITAGSTIAGVRLIYS